MHFPKSYFVLVVLLLSVFSSCSFFTNTASAQYTDLAYAASSSAQKLDLYLPTSGTSPYPVIIAIHGGAFKSGSKSDGQEDPMLKALSRGYAVASVNYRLSSEAEFPAAVYDIKAAIRWLRANASLYQLDSEHFISWGGSSGGNLAAMIGLSGGATIATANGVSVITDNPSQSDSVQAFVDWYGPLNFATMDAEFAALGQSPVMGATCSSSSPETAYLGETISANGSVLITAANPETYIDANDPPAYIQHGTEDRNIPITQSKNLRYKLLNAYADDSKVVYLELSGAGHGGTQFTQDSNVALILDFLDTQLGR